MSRSGSAFGSERPQHGESVGAGRHPEPGGRHEPRRLRHREAEEGRQDPGGSGSGPGFTKMATFYIYILDEYYLI